MNGRWAMAACAGILFTEILGKGKWFEAGAGEYWMPNNALIALEALIMGFLELKRYQGWKDSGVSGFVNAFPFDPAGMSSPDMAVKEVKNGRLAMVAFIGFAVAALVTREGPVEVCIGLACLWGSRTCECSDSFVLSRSCTHACTHAFTYTHAHTPSYSPFRSCSLARP